MKIIITNCTEYNSAYLLIVCVSPNNNIYGALDSRIIKISPSGSVDVFIDFKKHFMPYYVKDELVSGMALAENGDIYVSYGFLNSVSMQISAVFKITPAGEISRLAGSLESMSGHRDGVGDDALFHSPYAISLYTTPTPLSYAADLIA